MRSRRHHDPLPSRLTDAILSLQPTALWPLDDGNGPLRDLTGRWPATVTGSPTYGVAAAPSSIGRGVAWPGGSVYATTATNIPNASTGITLFGFLRTTDATAANRVMVGRAFSHRLYLNTSHVPTMQVLQSGGANHAAINAGALANTGRWWLVVGTFNGTTVWCHMMNDLGTYSAQSDSTLTSTWGVASASGVEISAYGGGIPMIGTTARVGVINNRVLSAAEVRWLGSVAFGG